MTAADLDYLAARAVREAVLAADAADRRVAAVHADLSRRYGERLGRALAGRGRATPPPP